MDFLTSESQRIDPRRIRLTGVADKEPLVARVYEPESLAVNRRVEIIASEALVQQFDAAQQRETSAPLETGPTPDAADRGPQDENGS